MAIEGLLSALNVHCVAVILIGVVIGIIFGSIPGLTSTMGVALCLPLTFSMSPLDGHINAGCIVCRWYFWWVDFCDFVKDSRNSVFSCDYL